ncbi:hypothetical protein FPOAC1_012258 [Fusarium poae]|uniref:hypothetical protein n=1 Tax=Fusarium poae TaxID=36050 RepID=UPI001CEB1202|nr:hypothetical protein FPOAC1_012258 [Fusarium poae]KAG8667427.1 hypothetical protein FPOAC1_012258 [Fusarium poae]
MLKRYSIISQSDPCHRIGWMDGWMDGWDRSSISNVPRAEPQQQRTMIKGSDLDCLTVTHTYDTPFQELS